MSGPEAEGKQFRSVSHALLDRALEVMAKDPVNWTHADDLFMLSLYGGRNKADIVPLFSGAQLQDRMYGRMMKRAKAEHPGSEDASDVHPQIVAMRPYLAAWIDWQMLLAPLRITKKEFWGSIGKKKAAWRKSDYQIPEAHGTMAVSNEESDLRQ